MHSKFLSHSRYTILSLSLCLSIGLSSAAGAVDVPDIPGSADVGRIKPEQKLPTIDQTKGGSINIPSSVPTVEIPEGAKGIKFELKNVRIEGATAFTPEQLQDIYTPYIGRTITLDVAYIMAGAMTERYRNAGYFLSLAYIPPQKISTGIVTIKVVEGYVGSVKFNGETAEQSVVQEYIHQLKAKRPLKSQEMESFLLRLNDLPGYDFSGVLSELEGGEEGPVELILIRKKKAGSGSFNFDNNGSRFLGPNQASLSYSASVLPLQQTSLSGVSSLPSDELKFGTFNHSIALAPAVTADVAVGYTSAKPGYTLKPFEIDSSSTFLSGSLNYQWIRQRQENLALKFTVDSRNSTTDILDSPLTRDHIRALRANATYDVTDSWQGYNIISATLSRGIDGLGSSKKGDNNLSREEATPDFTKAELSLTRLQGISQDWSLLMTAALQRASGPLYSSEEFGYGGQAFGRAFDLSEISGDHGAAGSLELRYGGWSDWQPVSISPYAFYDIGMVWNDDIAQLKRESGASAGFGVRASSGIGLSGNIGLAWPLTREVGTPIYGQNSTQPRILLQIGQSF
jgi:hemolysin activation/secretion protein